MKTKEKQHWCYKKLWTAFIKQLCSAKAKYAAAEAVSKRNLRVRQKKRRKDPHTLKQSLPEYITNWMNFPAKADTHTLTHIYKH